MHWLCDKQLSVGYNEIVSVNCEFSFDATALWESFVSI